MSGTATPDSADGTGPAHPSPLWRNRDFRRFFAGQFVTNAGDSLYGVAVLWLVFELSGSTALTGVANSLLLLPYLLQIVAGPVVDRLSVKRVLVGAQVGQGVVVLVFPLAAAAGFLRVELILATVPVLALLTLLTAPVPTTLVPRLVAEDQLSRANSALATISLGLDMVFDALGGAFIAVFGATALFVLDSATFAVATVLFAGMTVPTVEGPAGTGDETGASGETERPVRSALREYADDLRDGIDVLRGTVFVEMLFTSAVFNFAVGVTLAILPAFGQLRGGPAVYGALLGALGIGRLVGSLAATRLEGVPYGRLKAGSYLAAACCWLGAVSAPSTGVTVGLFGLAWVAAGASAVLVQTVNQRVFSAGLLGRVAAIKGTASTATLPVGSLVGGVVADQVGVVTTMGLAALGFGFAGCYFAVRPRLRNLPAVADADPSDFGVDTDALPADHGEE
ncbi:MFS transporter [Halobacteriales archaeon QH_7_68_42]|nr:MAG: MFS transporter [Halobacteriales archaeon QH_7_68_42]